MQIGLGNLAFSFPSFPAGAPVGAANGLHIDAVTQRAYLGGTLLENSTIADNPTGTGTNFSLAYTNNGAANQTIFRSGTRNITRLSDLTMIGVAAPTGNALTQLQLGDPFYFNSMLSIFKTDRLITDRPIFGMDNRTLIPNGTNTGFFLNGACYLTAYMRGNGTYTLTNNTTQAGNAVQTNLGFFSQGASDTITLGAAGVLSGQYSSVSFVGPKAYTITPGFIAAYTSDMQRSGGVTGTVLNVVDFYGGSSSDVAGTIVATNRYGFYCVDMATQWPGGTIQFAFFAAGAGKSFFGGGIATGDATVPFTNGALNWKLGSVTVAGVATDLTRYVEVEINGTKIKLIVGA